MRIILAAFLLAAGASAETYHLDCAAGADTRSGTSPAAAWRTLERASSVTFAPGDSILLRRGTRCEGALSPKGSGEPGRPIRIGAYGEGPLPIVAARSSEAALKLIDQSGWEIENLEISGGSPYGVFVGSTPGNRRLKHFVLRNLVVHDVGGRLQRKASGLVVITGANGVTLEDILVDGVTAYRTSQWAGIFVSGSRTRARNVVVRNSMVHDVQGDGIVIFQAENGLIERSAAWYTGLEERQTIGTPNAIWTWNCRNCAVQYSEGFWIDSPSVDGGVFDIDWGNDDNTVQYNFGHDAQGYCAAVFAAAHRATTNSAIRHNVCVNNARSPKLARRQGDIFVSTWNGGSLDGLSIEKNTIVWNPPVDAPAIQMKDTVFSGTRPAIVSGNILYSSVPSLARSVPPVKFERNVYWRAGQGSAAWWYGDRPYNNFEGWHGLWPEDSWQNPDLAWLFKPTPAAGAPAQTPLAADPVSKGKWQLLLFAGERDPDARSQVVFVQAALAQYRYSGLDATVIHQPDANLQYDWNLGDVRSRKAGPADSQIKAPALLLISPNGEIVRRWNGFRPPADLGLALKYHLGSAPGNPPLRIEE